jgi:DNA processing protein
VSAGAVGRVAPTPAVAAAMLAAVRGIGLDHRAVLLSRWPDPRDAVRAVVSGAAICVLRPRYRNGAALVQRWRRELDADRVSAVLAARGTAVLFPSGDGFPFEPELVDAPTILLAEGEHLDVLARPRVAVVGSRAATPHGLDDARQLGRHLAGRGVAVVSGLAIGIDGAAHEGAVASTTPAATVGVVATGLDVTYPRRHEALTRDVRRRGLLVSEQWFGVPPERHLFPIRNRIIAALADVVVVVEAAATGGALHTARWALEYGRPVLVPPGSRRNAVAAGTNALLREGAHPLLEPSDVLEALALTPGSRRGDGIGAPRPGDEGWSGTPPASGSAPGPTLSRQAYAVLRACGGEPTTPDQLATRLGLEATVVSRAVRELVDAGRMTRSRGWLWPR